jgi:D-3-phosphoglycerate dehydrogenase
VHPAGRPYGRNGKYGACEFWVQFGVVMMADVSTAKENVKRVFYVRFLNHQIYLDLIATRPEIRLDKLENDTPEAAAAPIVSAAHAYQVSSARDELPAQFHVNKDLLGRAPNLLIVSTGGAGYDTVNVKDCTDAGVLVVNQTGGNADAVAAHVLGMMLMLSKQVVQVNNALRKGTMKDRNIYMGNDINNKTIGIVGLGNVGRRIAKLCATVFDMQVLAYDPFLDEKTIAERNATKVELDELCRRSDFVSINCPLDDTTRNMISTRQFGLMQKHAYFITAARGFITDEKALEEALRNKQIAGAGLDVFAKEPPAMDHPLLQFDNVIASPHTAGVTKEARANMGKFAAEQLILTLDGKKPPRMVNPEVWPAYSRRFERAFGIRPEG